MIRDAAGSLYGVADYGTTGYGVIFKVDAGGQFSVLHTFTGGTGGAYPGGLTLDSNGNLYGTTSAGGAYNEGTIFKLDPTEDLTLLYSFTGENDGAPPYDAKLLLDSAGNIYGANCGNCREGGVGTVYKLDTNGQLNILFTFPAGKGAAGAWPDSGVVFDSAGNLYGTTAYGGKWGGGVVYKLTPSAQ